MSSERNSIARLNINPPTTTEDSRTRRRSAVACKNCNVRKVRCNVASSGPPCANCQHDETDCEILPRKKHGPKRKKQLLQAVETQRSRDTCTRNDASLLEDQPHSLSASPQSILPTEHLRIDPILVEDNTSRQCTSQQLPSSNLDEAVNSNSYAVALDADVACEPEGRPTMIYVGDRQGASNFVFDLCNGPSQTSHYLVPRVITTRARSPEDLAYLRAKGCFSVPSKDVCEDLIRAFFLHVHPFLPIIDAHKFLDDFVQHGYQNINLLLFWSVSLAATNFVEVDVLQRAGYTSRKDMKRAMYQRAKCLYDIDYEEDKLSLIQSVILMAFWYSDMEDRTGSWHWIGIAIGLCQTLGLHRTPRQDIVKNHLSTGLLRRIWWSCIVRDRWLSLSMGRPMRIQVEDCDTPMPTVEDVNKELGCIPHSIARSYLPYDPSRKLAGLWINLLKISNVLGTMLRIFYRLKGAKADLEDMKNCEEEILKLAPVSEIGEEGLGVMFHIHQLQLFYETTVIVLHRPYLLQTAINVALPEEAAWQVLSRQRAKSAATNVNVVLEKLIDMDMIKFLKPMSVTCLIPAMQVHLFESTSANSLLRNLGSHKLRLCMIVLSELRATYWGADFIYRLFERAEAKLFERQTRAADGNTPRLSANIVSPLTSESSSNMQLQPDATRVMPNTVGDSHEFLWDPFGLDAMMNGDNSFMNYLAFTHEGSEKLAADLSPMSESMQVDYGINTLLNGEEFNNQFLYMGQST